MSRVRRSQYTTVTYHTGTYTTTITAQQHKNNEEKLRFQLNKIQRRRPKKKNKKEISEDPNLKNKKLLLSVQVLFFKIVVYHIQHKQYYQLIQLSTIVSKERSNHLLDRLVINQST